MAQKIFEDESLIKKASYLKLLAVNLAEGMKTGTFKSLYKGQGIEFSGVRDYNRGDDIRSIDWNVTARMGKPFVKMFDEERELQIFIVLDGSFSMQLKDGKKTKYDVAKEASALLAVAGEINSCPVGAIIFNDDIFFASKSMLSKEHTMTLLKKMDSIEKFSEKKGSALKNALTGAQKMLQSRSMIFVISDFRTGDWQKAILPLTQHNDLIAIRVESKFDKELPAIGSVVFEDSESDLKIELPSSSNSFKKEWLEYNEAQKILWKNYCTKHGIFTAVMNTDDNPLEVLNLIFGSRK